MTETAMLNNQETEHIENTDLSNKKLDLELLKDFDTNDKIVDRFKKIKSTIITLLREQEILVKLFKKNCNLEVKKMSGRKKKKNNIDGEQKKSGFTKPTNIPDKIADFLNIDQNTIMPRTDVTKKIYEYIKTNNLQDVNDKKKSNTDEKLSKLFDLPLNSVIEFSTFQTLLSKVYNPDKYTSQVPSTTEQVSK